MKVAVVGATGLVGSTMLRTLEERNFPVTELIPVASERSKGKKVAFKGKEYAVVTLQEAVAMHPHIALFSAGGSTSLEWAEPFAATGCYVIDNSSAWRMNPAKKLVVPEVNASVLTPEDRVIANPNCSTAQLVVALKPLHDAATIKRVVVSTYQSVSGAGKEGMDELFEQSRAVFVADPVTAKKFTKRIAFNVIPHIDVFMEDGYTKEEWKMVAETKKMLDPKIKLTATAVRVPVFIGHSEAVNMEFEKPITAEEAREILRNAPGCLVIDKRENGGYVTPYESAGEDATYISRIREDITVENGLAMWVVSDNLRKGAALNTIQIAELLVARGLIKPKALAA